jgi:hypothetical protein
MSIGVVDECSVVILVKFIIYTTVISLMCSMSIYLMYLTALMTVMSALYMSVTFIMTAMLLTLFFVSSIPCHESKLSMMSL